MHFLVVPIVGIFPAIVILVLRGVCDFYLKGVSSPDSFLQCGYTWNLKWREGIFITREEFWAWGLQRYVGKFSGCKNYSNSYRFTTIPSKYAKDVSKSCQNCTVYKRNNGPIVQNPQRFFEVCHTPLYWRQPSWILHQSSRSRCGNLSAFNSQVWSMFLVGGFNPSEKY